MRAPSRCSFLGFSTLVFLAMDATACGTGGSDDGAGGAGASVSDGGAGAGTAATLEVIEAEFVEVEPNMFSFQATVTLTNPDATSLSLDPLNFWIRGGDGLDLEVNRNNVFFQQAYCERTMSVADGASATCAVGVSVPEGVSIRAVVYRNGQVDLVAPYDATLPADDPCLDACTRLEGHPAADACGANWIASCTQFCKDHPSGDASVSCPQCFIDAGVNLQCSEGTLHYALDAGQPCQEGPYDCPAAN